MAEHGEDDVAGGGEGEEGVGDDGSLGSEGIGFGWVAGEDGDGVAGGEESGGHGAAHHADADPPDSGLAWTYGDWVRIPCHHHTRRGTDRGAPKWKL